jgi:hypothetical protein
MNWMLFFVIASMSTSDKVVNTTTVPMATEELCNSAKAQLIQAYKATQGPNFLVIGECLRVRR